MVSYIRLSWLEKSVDSFIAIAISWGLACVLCKGSIWPLPFQDHLSSLKICRVITIFVTRANVLEMLTIPYLSNGGIRVFNDDIRLYKSKKNCSIYGVHGTQNDRLELKVWTQKRYWKHFHASFWSRGLYYVEDVYLLVVMTILAIELW